MSAADSSFAGPAAFLLALCALAAGFAIYSRLAENLRREGGQVRTAWSDLPDALVCLVLGGALGGLAFSAFGRRSPETPMRPDQVLQSGILLVAILAGIGGFLRARGLRLGGVLGLRRCPPLRVLGWAALLLGGAYPFVAGVSALTGLQLGEKAEPQPLIGFFREAAARADYGAIASVAVGAILLAPVCEEFLFRGYFYPVAKRYAGPWIAAPLTALLFAASHANLASLPALFVLALALTLAYERTGSLLVPIAMHALFNTATLAVLYLLSARGLAP